MDTTDKEVADMREKHSGRLLTRRAMGLAERVLADAFKMEGDQPSAERIAGVIGCPKLKVLNGRDAARPDSDGDFFPRQACGAKVGNE